MKIVKKYSDKSRVKAFSGTVPLEDLNIESKAITGEGDVVLDYRDVVFTAYASTWGTRDRDGEEMVAGAFRDSIRDFMKNPVALINHQNSVESIAGYYEELREDARGLYVRCRLSNAPDMKSVRFKVAERALRALSVAGRMVLGDDNRSIVSVNLWEISLVAIPSNPEALIDTIFYVRDLTNEEKGAESNFRIETAGAPVRSREPGVNRQTRIANIKLIKS